MLSGSLLCIQAEHLRTFDGNIVSDLQTPHKEGMVGWGGGEEVAVTLSPQNPDWKGRMKG